MRVFSRCFVVVSIVVVFSLGVAAQSPVPIKLYAGGGFAKQHRPGAFDENYKLGYHVAAGVGYEVFPMVEVAGEFRYHSFAPNLTIADLGDVGGGKVKASMFGLSARFAPKICCVPFGPYALAAGGFAKMSRDDFDFPGLTKVGTADGWNTAFRLDDQTKFYYSFGGGVTYKIIPKMSLFVEARYTSIQTEQDNSVFDKPIRFWAFTGGVRLL